MWQCGGQLKLRAKQQIHQSCTLSGTLCPALGISQPYKNKSKVKAHGIHSVWTSGGISPGRPCFLWATVLAGVDMLAKHIRRNKKPWSPSGASPKCLSHLAIGFQSTKYSSQWIQSINGIQECNCKTFYRQFLKAIFIAVSITTANRNLFLIFS